MKLDGGVIGAEFLDFVFKGNLTFVDVYVVLSLDLFSHFFVADGAEEFAVGTFFCFDDDLLIVQL